MNTTTAPTMLDIVSDLHDVGDNWRNSYRQDIVQKRRRKAKEISKLAKKKQARRYREARIFS